MISNMRVKLCAVLQFLVVTDRLVDNYVILLKIDACQNVSFIFIADADSN